MALEFIPSQQGQGQFDPRNEQLYGDPAEWKGSTNMYEGQDMSKLVKTYLEEQIPEEFQKSSLFVDFWAVLGNQLKLTFLKQEDLDFLEMMFEQVKITYIISRPRRKFTFKESLMLDNLKIHFITACKKAIGNGNHNERTILATQISQIIRSNTESFAGQ